MLEQCSRTNFGICILEQSNWKEYKCANVDRCDTSANTRSHLPHNRRHPRLLHGDGTHSRTGRTRIHCGKCVSSWNRIYTPALRGLKTKNKLPVGNGMEKCKENCVTAEHLYWLSIDSCVFVCLWPTEMLQHF